MDRAAEDVDREDLIASAGGNDWREGERMISINAAEKKPENRSTHSIFTWYFAAGRRSIFFS